MSEKEINTFRDVNMTLSSYQLNSNLFVTGIILLCSRKNII